MHAPLHGLTLTPWQILAVLLVLALLLIVVAGLALFLWGDPPEEDADDDALDEEELPATALSRPTPLEFGPDPVAAVAPGARLPARDPRIPWDDADPERAGRYARLRAFQQREAAIRSARRFM